MFYFCAFTDQAVKRQESALKKRGEPTSSTELQVAHMVRAPPTWSGPRLHGQGPAYMVRAPPTWSGHRLHGQGTAHMVRAPPTWSGHHPHGQGTAHMFRVPPTGGATKLTCVLKFTTYLVSPEGFNSVGPRIIFRA